MNIRQKFLTCTFLVSLAPLAVSGQAAAQENAVTTTFQKHAYHGGLEEGIGVVQALGRGDGERFASGALMFLHAVEGLQQDLYRYGAGNRVMSGRAGWLGRLIPIFRVPVAANPNSEIPTYEDTRAILERFSTRLARAEAELAEIGEDEFKLPVDLFSLSLDANGSGTIEQDEKLISVIAGLNPRSAMGGEGAALAVKFDAADAKWLQGYANLLKGFADTFLAFDYKPTFDSVFHVIFGKDATRFGRQLDGLREDPEMLALLRDQLADLKRVNEEKYPEAERKKYQDEAKRIREAIQAVRKDKAIAKDDKDKQLKALREKQAEVSAWQSEQRQETRAERRIQQRIDMLENPDLETVMAELEAANKELEKFSNLRREKRNEKRAFEKEVSKVVADTNLSESERARKTEALELKIAEVDGWLADHEKARQRAEDARKKLRNASGRSTGGDFGGILDAISFIHTVSWKVEDRERLESARLSLIRTMQLNQDVWRLARAETDNDAEWLPNAVQDGPFSGMEVTDEVIDGWLKTVGSVEKVLQGELLLPSLRFAQGINLKRYLAETERFDPVMFTTGPDTVAYAQAGEIWDGRLWRTLASPFGNRFMSFALWFN